MTLNEYCKDSWIKTEDRYYVSKHCCKEKIDLYRAIAHWQLDQVEKKLLRIESETADDEKKDKKLKFIRLYLSEKKACLIKQFQENGKSQAFSSSENDTLMKCLICGVFVNRRIWREVKEKLLRICPTRYDWEDGLSECFQILVERNLFYLLSFDLEKVRDRDNENVMKLLSGYIARCLYPREILRIYFGMKIGESSDEFELLPGSVLIIKPEISDEISDDMFSMFEKACLESPMYAFIHESVSDRKYRSAVSRRQKSNLKKYIEKCLTEKEHPILDPFHAGMITDYIEESLREGDDHQFITRLRKEHETAIERIISVFEEARNLFKLDNFISENKACIDRKSGSMLRQAEEAELANFIRQQLDKITENISYFRKITSEYIADEIGRMICEKEIDCLNRDFQD